MGRTENSQSQYRGQGGPSPQFIVWFLRFDRVEGPRNVYLPQRLNVLSTTCGGEPFGADGSNHLLLLACGAVYKEAGLFRLTEVTGHDPWNCQSRTACTIGPLQLSVTGSQLFCSIVCS